MANHARALLESALRERRLDRTLTTALPPLDRHDPAACISTGVAHLDACLRGGLPRGQMSELAGPASSGRTTLLLQLMAAATRRGEIVALVDTGDRLDVASAVAAGVALDRLLWIRGTLPDAPGALAPPGDSRCDHAVDRALKALNLVLQAGGFGLVAIDLAELSPRQLGRIPLTTWPRVQRAVEGSDTACVLLTARPLARSAGGLTLTLDGRPAWTGSSDRSRRFAGTAIRLRVVSPRKGIDQTVVVDAQASHDGSRASGQ